VKFSKERKVLLVLFGLGLVALVIDRMFFSPSEAAASTDNAAAPAVSVAPEPKPEASVPTHSGPSFAQQLSSKHVWTPGGVRDAFQAPREWVGARVAQEEPQPEEAESEFAKRHRLSAVLPRVDKATGTTDLIAIIGGGTYRKGQVVDGYTISDLHAGSGKDQWAVFQRKDEVVKVRVASSKEVEGVQVTDKRANQELMGPPAPLVTPNPAAKPEPH